MKLTTMMLATAAILLGASAAEAGTITPYTGSDDGAPTSGPFPDSAAAQASFLAAAGPTSLVTFESNAVGFYSPISVTGASITFGAGTPNFGNGFSGISNTTSGNLYGFNITPGGSNWLGFSGGSATFTFTNPVDAFGAYFTGLQTDFTTALTVTFNDGTSELEDVPVNTNGGATYWGFTDSADFSSLTITDLSDDAWGLDDVSFTGTSTPVPEPFTLSLFGAGLAGAAALRRRKKA